MSDETVDLTPIERAAVFLRDMASDILESPDEFEPDELLTITVTQDAWEDLLGAIDADDRIVKRGEILKLWEDHRAIWLARHRRPG